MGRTVLYTSLAQLDQHDTGSWHPERPGRLPAVDQAVADPEIAEAIVRFDPRQATVDEMARAHDRDHLARIEAFIGRGGGEIDADTHVSAGSWETARWAAGSGLAAIEALDRGEGDAAFVNIRPPGHHATADQAMGFCIVNNAAVAAASLADRGERVAIFDWDVHHGNGTQDIFFNDPRVLYLSTHEHPQYPGTGRAHEVGNGEGRGLTANVPLPSGSNGDLAVASFDEIVGPAIEEFAPSWILVSAGFDAHRADPLAGLNWTAGDYALLTGRIAALAPSPGRVLVFLEGGYSLEALTTSVAATIGELTGTKSASEPPSKASDRTAVGTAADIRSRSLLDPAD